MLKNESTSKTTNVVNFISELRHKLEAGLISKEQASNLAVLALNEVAEDEKSAAPQEAAEPAAAPAEESDDVSDELAVDPKSRILSALTSFEQDLAPALKKFQDELNALLAETSGAAVPLGEFTIGAEELNAKVSIAQADQHSVVCTYSLKQDWKVQNLQLPMPVTGSKAEDACHLGLRRELLAVAEEVLDHSASQLAWSRYSVPREKISRLAKAATGVSDLRVAEIAACSGTTATAKSWERWALGAVTQLLGSDYVLAEGKTASKGAL